MDGQKHFHNCEWIVWSLQIKHETGSQHTEASYSGLNSEHSALPASQTRSGLSSVLMSLQCEREEAILWRGASVWPCGTLNVSQALCCSGRSGQWCDTNDVLFTLMKSCKRLTQQMKCAANMWNWLSWLYDKLSLSSFWAIQPSVKDIKSNK